MQPAHTHTATKTQKNNFQAQIQKQDQKQKKNIFSHNKKGKQLSSPLFIELSLSFDF